MKKCKNCNYYKTGECILSEPMIETPGCPDWKEIPRFIKKIGTIGRGNCMGLTHVWLKSDGTYGIK